MTKEEILALKPGRDLNMAVAKHIFEHDVTEDEIFGDMEGHMDLDGSTVWDNLSPYSEDMTSTLQVAEKMISLGHDDIDCWGEYGGGSYTPTEAICKRALLVVLGLYDE